MSSEAYFCSFNKERSSFSLPSTSHDIYFSTPISIEIWNNGSVGTNRIEEI